MKKLTVAIVFFAVLFFSCPEEDTEPVNIDAQGVTKKTFKVQNFKTGGVNSVETGLIANGKNCHIWVGRGTNVTKKEVESIANTYDNKIYKILMDYFSFHEEDEQNYDGEELSNTLDMIKFLVGGDGKLNIILVDIPDNYQQGVNNAYTAGYFWAGDLYKSASQPNSNECAAIFIDTNPAVPGSEESNSTLAHEMQHMMSFLNGVLFRENDFDVWIDEGLSLSAEYLYLNKQLTSRINWYKNDQSGLIKKGNNFFVWGNRKTENSYASLDDYATDYLFFQWLRLQTANDIYWSIMFSFEYNYQAVLDAYNDRASSNLDWDTLLQTWLAANQINAATGPYGYKNQVNITAHAAPAQTSINLYPGEGVYSKTTDSQPNTSGSGANIKYAYLTTNSVSTSFSTNSTLLTYNKNTNWKNGTSEKGITTGAVASEHFVPDARFIESFKNEPVRIDARDMMGQDKWRESYSNGVSRLRKGGLNDE